MGCELRPLRENRNIGVDEPPVQSTRSIPYDRQQFQAIGVLELRVAIRELPSQIAFAERTKDRVGERVSSHVGIRMAPQSFSMRNLNSAKDQPPSRFEGMEIEALADAKFH